MSSHRVVLRSVKAFRRWDSTRCSEKPQFSDHAVRHALCYLRPECFVTDDRTAAIRECVTLSAPKSEDT